MATAVETEITLSDAIQAYARQNYSYGSWDFEGDADDNGWTSVDMLVDEMGSPISSVTSSTHYYGTTWAFARGASNAEEIIRILDEVDALSDGCDWSYGPGDSFVFNAGNEAMAKAAEDIMGALAGYPVLNEERCSEIEDEQNHPSDTECYSDDPDCGCMVRSHECSDEFRNLIEADGVSAIVDGDWYCHYCSEWYDVTAEQADWIAQWQIRYDNAECERNGQLTLI